MNTTKYTLIRYKSYSKEWYKEDENTTTTSFKHTNLQNEERSFTVKPEFGVCVDWLRHQIWRVEEKKYTQFFFRVKKKIESQNSTVQYLVLCKWIGDKRMLANSEKKSHTPKWEEEKKITQQAVNLNVMNGMKTYD